MKKCFPPRALGNTFVVFGSLAVPRPLQELSSRRWRSQRNSQFPKDLKPSRPQRLQRLAGDACQREEINYRLRIASSGSATIVAPDRKQKTKTIAKQDERKSSFAASPESPLPQGSVSGTPLDQDGGGDFGGGDR